MRSILFVGVGLLGACTDSKIGLGAGEPPDARLYADVYTWECEDNNAGTLYEGVFAYELSLEYGPDGLAARALPSSGCSAGLDVFPSDAGANGMDIPDASAPTRSGGAYSGTLDRRAEGFYADSAFDNRSGCIPAEDVLGDTVSLADAGSLSGASSPAGGYVTDVALEGEVDEEVGIPFGASVTASWDASGWDRSWVQVRREKDGGLIDSVTCAADGDGYTLDDDAWSLLNEALEADVTNLYVAFETQGTSTTPDGQEVLTYTRAIHVAVVQD